MRISAFESSHSTADAVELPRWPMRFSMTSCPTRNWHFLEGENWGLNGKLVKGI